MKKIHNVDWTEEKIKDLWEIYETTEQFKEDRFLPIDFYKCLYNYTRKFMKKRAKILDIGCGSGALIDLLYQKGYEVYGCDLSEKNIENLKIKYSNTDIKFISCGISKLDFQDNYFDYIFITEVLEHLLPSTLETGLNEIKRVLKSQGKVIVTVPYKEKISYIVCPDCGAVFNPAQHFTSFDETTIKELFSKFGFEIDFCKLFPKVPVTGNKIKDFFKKLLALIDKRAISFMYGSIFITVASKKSE